jgi:hypothetical protein
MCSGPKVDIKTELPNTCNKFHQNLSMDSKDGYVKYHSHPKAKRSLKRMKQSKSKQLDQNVLYAYHVKFHPNRFRATVWAMLFADGQEWWCSKRE